MYVPLATAINSIQKMSLGIKISQSGRECSRASQKHMLSPPKIAQNQSNAIKSWTRACVTEIPSAGGEMSEPLAHKSE